MWNHLQRLFVDVKENPQVRVVVVPAQQALAASPFNSEDFQKGWRAFLEKCPPQFRGS